MSKLRDWRFSKQLRMAHATSEHASLDFDAFVQAVQRVVSGKESPIDFDERFYLMANEDVAKAVAANTFHSGYVHFCINGQHEPRPFSTLALSRQFGIQPHHPPLDDLMAPLNGRPPVSFGPDLSALPAGDRQLLVMLIPHLRKELFYAGYSGFFNDMVPLFDAFEQIIVVVLHEGIDTELATRYSPKINVIGYQELGTISTKPELTICFDSETWFLAKQVFGDLTRTIYYCQDFEAGFHPYGTQYIRAEAAIAQSQNLVLSTSLLRDFIAARGLLSSTARVFVTSPTIDLFEVPSQKNRRLFFYFRPERFNTRNLPELVAEAVEQFCTKYTGYELFLVGTVGTYRSFRRQGNDVYVINKLPKEDYQALITSCDVVISMIYSAHPGVIAFQAAASGIPTVTNTFDNRSVALLNQISTNIVPYDPLRETLLGRIEQALLMEKGRPSFNETLYAGEETETFPAFVQSVLQLPV